MLKTQRLAIALLVAAVAALVLSWGQPGAGADGAVLANTGSGVPMLLAFAAAVVVAVGGAFIAMWVHKNRQK